MQHIPNHILERKGARTMDEVPKEVLIYLNCGTIETKNLMELLCVNHTELVYNAFSALNLHQYIAPLQAEIELNSTLSSWKNIATIGQTLNKNLLNAKEKLQVFNLLIKHPSDVVRGYGAYLLKDALDWDVIQKYEYIKSLADDPNPGVREMAWLALRNDFINNLEASIPYLSDWTTSVSANLRRFASEISRPNGVWCAHITALKKNPELGLPILEPLKNDASKYVQNSVANWLNDASKSSPNFVIQLCTQWKAESPSKNTTYIVKRGLRTLRKKNIVETA